MADHLWNEDGTPKRPDPTQYGDPEKYAQHPAADLAADEPGLLIDNEATGWSSMARWRQQAKVMRSPEVGDIVHFWHGEKATCFAAMVMETDSFTDDAEIRVHVPYKAFQDWRSAHDEGKGDETWHWPCGEGQ